MHVHVTYMYPTYDHFLFSVKILTILQFLNLQATFAKATHSSIDLCISMYAVSMMTGISNEK